MTHPNQTEPCKCICFKRTSIHPELTRERSIRILLFEIKRVFVYISTIFKLTNLSILYFFIQNVYANKKNLSEKALELCKRGQIVIESHSFLKY